MVHKKIILLFIGVMPGFLLQAQTPQKADTVIVNLANTSRLIFTMEDSTDIEVLRNFDFQELFNDILDKLENNDTTSLAVSNAAADSVKEEEERWALEEWDENEEEEDEYEDEGEESDDWGKDYSMKWSKKTWQSFNFDLGLNNYLSDGTFPDVENALYSVRPWGSWYVGINSIQRTKLGNKFFIEWGLGVSWYNFKFEKDNIHIQKDDTGVIFLEDTVHSNFIKSKLTVSYINASIIPVLDFGGKGKKSRVWEKGGGFRIGIGPYVGYRIGSYGKLVYKDDGDREKEKSRSNFYLENFRYGLRLQAGYRSTDVFVNYDLNDLFITPRGPSLNAFSFGIVF